MNIPYRLLPVGDSCARPNVYIARLSRPHIYDD